MYYVLFLAPWFATFAMTVQLGLWSNTILLAQIALSGIIAFGFYQPVAVMIDEASSGGYTYFADYLAIWALFCGAMLILKILDANLSKKRGKYAAQADQYGGPAVGLLAGWLMSGIVLASLHTAPIPVDSLKVTPYNLDTSSPLQSPDLAWLKIMETVSAPAGLGQGEERTVFSADKFIRLYHGRREAFAETPESRVRRGR